MHKLDIQMTNKQTWYRLETDKGTWYVHTTQALSNKELLTYTNGTKLLDVKLISGYGVRLNRANWEVFSTKRAAYKRAEDGLQI